jgi:hypothetical protein
MRRSSLLLFCLAGCSPYGYSNETKKFSTDVSQLSDSVSGGYASLTSDLASRNRRVLIETRSYVVLPRSCAVPTSTSAVPCVITAARAPEIPPHRDMPVVDEANKAAATAAADALNEYVAALAAVTNATDQKNYQAALAQLVSAVKGLSSVIPVPIVGTVAPAAINLFGWLVGVALDEQRFDTLKDAVDKVDKKAGPAKPMESIGNAIALGIEEVVNKRKRVLWQEAENVVSQIGPHLGDEAYSRKLTDLQTILDALNSLRALDPESAGAGMAKAHEELAMAVDDPHRNLGTLIGALSTFATQASALRTALTPASPSSSSTPSKSSK